MRTAGSAGISQKDYLLFRADDHVRVNGGTRITPPSALARALHASSAAPGPCAIAP